MKSNVPEEERYREGQILEGIYAFLAQEEIIYIGASVRCHNRVYSHKTQKWWPEVTGIIIIPVQAEGHYKLEQRLIMKYRPKYNQPWASHPEREVCLDRAIEGFKNIIKDVEKERAPGKGVD